MALLCGCEKQTTTWGHGAQGLQGDPQAGTANQRALQAQSSASPGAPPARPPHDLDPPTASLLTRLTGCRHSLATV